MTLGREGWKSEFEDVAEIEAELRWHYYKSECRPLHDLHPLYRQGITNKSFKHAFREWLELRDRARKDLYWLGHDCIASETSGAGFVEHVHREMCEMFVAKDFDGVYREGYTLDDVRKAIGRQARQKEMLLLAPRGSFKSTVNKVDCVQWMLNAPDIRILIMTGSGGLSDKFLKEVKGFFFKPENEKPTYFQSLFPEYILTGKDGVSLADLYCPARICRQEGNPSLWVNSIDGVLAGWHCDVMKGDDIVNEGNSNNEDTREKLKDRYDNASENLPDEWAFRDHLGTRYVGDDWYGSRIADMKKYAEEDSIKFLTRAAWTVKPEYQHIPIKQLRADMVELYFPEKLTFKSLMQKCRHNEKLFRCQQLNEPAGADVSCDFDEETLRAHVIIPSKVPYPDKGERRKIVITWDTAHGNQVTNDYCSGAAGWCDERSRSLFVLEVRHDKWKDSQLAVQVVDMHMKWKPMFSEIEKFAGWELLAAEIQRIALQRYKQYIPLSWRTVDNTSGAKRNRVKGLETLLSDDRLWFVDGDWIEDLVTQFTRFTGLSKRRKDDIPDSISFLQKLIPAERTAPDESSETDQQRKEREASELREKFAAQQEEAAYRTVFQAPPPPKSEPEPEPVAADPGPQRIFGRIGIHL